MKRYYFIGIGLLIFLCLFHFVKKDTSSLIAQNINQYSSGTFSIKSNEVVRLDGVVVVKPKVPYIDTLVIYPYTTIPHLDTLLYYLNMGVKEATGHNDGYYVELFLKSVHGHKGDAWCAAFQSFCLSKNEEHGVLLATRSALAANFINKKSITAKSVLNGGVKIPPGTLGIMRHGSTIKGHIFAVYIWDKVHGQTVEGNSGNKVSFLERIIQPRNYFRITK